MTAVRAACAFPAGIHRIILSAALAMLAGCVTSRQDASQTVDGSAPGKILIRYEVGQEDASRPGAFLVHRAATPAGPFVQLNEEPLALSSRRPGQVVTLYEDRGVVLGRTYHYYLERVGPDGQKTKATEVAAATALLPLQAEDQGKR